MKKLIILAAVLVSCIALFSVNINRAEIYHIDKSVQNTSGPYNLEAVLFGVNNVFLSWSNPVYINQPMGFRIYCNGDIALYIPGYDIVSGMLENVCNGCHQFYVTAYYDTGCESVPSNTVELTVTKADDNVLASTPPALLLYPNPFRSQVSISLKDSHPNTKAEVSIYNTKGQLIRKLLLDGKSPSVWDRKDNSGSKVCAGTYFIKTSSSVGSHKQKLILID
ncbi:MAG: T9SS type A sorting domain-containing protein [Candidatus Cloacimonetes bacterium]|nr:T9SS type A sorting domain-containing protein [Candidatus Cloacimonadota bacterium]